MGAYFNCLSNTDLNTPHFLSIIRALTQAWINTEGSIHADTTLMVSCSTNSQWALPKPSIQQSNFLGMNKNPQQGTKWCKGTTSWDCYMLDTAPSHRGQRVICPHASRDSCLVEDNQHEIQDCISMFLLKETGSLTPGLGFTAASLTKATHEMLPAGSFIARYCRMLQKRGEKKKSKLKFELFQLKSCPEVL